MRARGIVVNYTMPKKQRPLNYFLVVLAKQNQQYCVVGFSKTINPLELAGYEMIIANSAPVHTHGIILLLI